MATAKGDDDEDTQTVIADSDEVIGDINCSICLQEFKCPRTLPCMHTFCQHCLNDYIVSLELDKSEGTHFPCRVCGQEVKPPFPEKSTKEWAAMFQLSPMTISMLSQGKSKVEYQCNVCQLEGRQKPITCFCLTCKEGFCAQCTKYHTSFTAMKDHTLVPSQEVMKNTQEIMKLSNAFLCTRHEGEQIKLYCEDHKAECCISCCFQKHTKCSKVRDLKSEAKMMLAVTSPEHCIDEMKALEAHLNKLALADQANVAKVHSQGNQLKENIHGLRIQINELMEKLEQMTDMVTSRVNKEEDTKKSERSQQCLSLAAAIRSSCKILEIGSRHGSDTEKLLTLMRSEEQLGKYTEQVVSKFEEVESVDVSLELHPNLKGLLSLNAEDAAIVKIVKTKEAMQVKEALRKKGVRPLKECQIEKTGEVTVKCPSSGKVPFYTGAVYLPEGNAMLVDRGNHRCCLYDSNFQHISHYIFQLTEDSYLWDLSVVNDKEVVVSMPDEKKLQFLNVEQEIRPTRAIATRFPCYGIATLNKDRIILSGHTDTGKFYWCIICLSGEELSYHEVEGGGEFSTYLAVNNSEKRIYMSCYMIDTLFCFHLDGEPDFTYKKNNLHGPKGVGCDAEGNIYLVDLSETVHALSPNGSVLKVCKSYISCPQRICFSCYTDDFFITNNVLGASETICLCTLR